MLKTMCNHRKHRTGWLNAFWKQGNCAVDITRGGYILADVSVAVVLMAVALLPLQAMFLSSQLHLAAARNLTVATMLAQARLEELLSFPYDSMNSQEKTPFPDQPGFFYSVAIDSVPGNLMVKTILVTVYYPEAGREKQITLKTQRTVPVIEVRK
ncbi:MAG TPA: hypothetical protein GXX25_00390 [Desulfotomaculum sp.]|nr:hypothetical protein [Desulfotomaculum sp.]